MFEMKVKAWDQIKFVYIMSSENTYQDLVSDLVAETAVDLIEEDLTIIQNIWWFVFLIVNVQKGKLLKWMSKGKCPSRAKKRLCMLFFFELIRILLSNTSNAIGWF